MKFILYIVIFFVSFTYHISAQWIHQNSGTTERFMSNYFLNENIGWSAGNDGTIVKTTNGGEEWFSQSVNTSDNIHSIIFTDSLNGWIALYEFIPERHGSVMHTSDGGETWTTQLSITGATFHSVFFRNAKDGWVAGSSGVMFRTFDGGQSWFEITPTIYWLYSVYFIDDQTGWASGGMLGQILKTTNGGSSWFPQSIPTNDRIMSLFFLDNNNGWGVGAGGRIVKTTNGGQNWQLVPSGTVEELRSVKFVNSSEGWAVGLGGVILHSIDGGNSWSFQTSNTESNLFGVSFIDEITGWVSGENGVILKTNNGGVPVELVSFSATQSRDKVLLSWITATEINNQGFNVERRFPDQKDWEKIGFIEGNGTTTEIHHYSFTDNIPSQNFNHKVYYRLKQMDFNGTYEYSDEVEVMLSNPEGFILEQNYPNPFNPSTEIKFSTAAKGVASLKVYDLLGREVATLLNKELEPGSYNLRFDAKDLPSGVYLYTLKVDNFFSQTRKMLLMK